MKHKKIEVDGEKVYLKKNVFGYRVVHPIRDDEGNIVWVNLIFGGRENLLKLIFIIFLALLFYVGINELISNYKLIAEKPCDFCEDCYITDFRRQQQITEAFNRTKVDEFLDSIKIG